MTLHDRIARAMCCPSGVCCSPGACYAEDRSRPQLVDIHAAIPAVIAAVRDEWRKQAGSELRDGDHPV
jgi:hypothetical protein